MVKQFSLEPRSAPVCLVPANCSPEQRARCVCLYDHLAVRAADDNDATAELLAVKDTQSVIERARPGLLASTQQVIESVGRVESRLSALRTFVSRGEVVLLGADRADARAWHAGDGPYRRDRRVLPRPFAWLMIALSALFDTVFLGQFFRFLVDADPTTSWGRFQVGVSYLPGAVIAYALLLAGLWLGEAMERWRDRRAGGPRSFDVPRPDWLTPAIAVAVVLTTVGCTAWARPKFLNAVAEAGRVVQDDAGGGESDLIPGWVVVLLLVTLAVTAVAGEALARNSYADAGLDLQRRRNELDAEYSGLLRQVDESLASLRQRWHALREQVAGVLSEVEDLWASLARYRGEVAPVVVNEDGQVTAGTFGRLVRHTPLPSPAFGPVLVAAEALEHHRPTPLEQAYEELVKQAVEQWAATPGPAVAPRVADR